MTEVIGLIGALFYLLAFLEVARGKWDGKSFWFEINNLIGSLFLGVYAIQKHAYMSIALNAVWAVVALYAIHHIVVRHHRRSKK
jgi:hypothetical protein